MMKYFITVGLIVVGGGRKEGKEEGGDLFLFWDFILLRFHRKNSVY